MSRSPLDEAFDYASARLKEEGGDIFRLPVPLQTVVVVYSAQGIIDNGGLEYFYENDFDGLPPYGFFVDVYRRIGAEDAASCIETSAAMFPFSEPHLSETSRQVWLDSVKHDESNQFVKLSRKICGDPSVFPKLADYVNAHRHAFQAV